MQAAAAAERSSLVLNVIKMSSERCRVKRATWVTSVCGGIRIISPLFLRKVYLDRLSFYS
jgi:hypothetical protein